MCIRARLPNGYSDHYVPDGFERDYEQGYDNEISFLHAYVDANDKSIFYYVDCAVIQDYGQIVTFDNEHTVYELSLIHISACCQPSAAPTIKF